MKALIIKPIEQLIEIIELSENTAALDNSEIAKIIGFDSIATDAIDAKNQIYFDEDCFIRGADGRFKIDTLIPIAGAAVIVGVNANILCDVSISINDLKTRIEFS